MFNEEERTGPDRDDALADRRLPRCPSGIKGLDDILGGGLPRGRPTLVCGAAGCGKTLLGIEFLVRGATEFDEPGVVMVFEETADDLVKNVRSLGFDLDVLMREKKLAIDYVRIEKSEIEETGEYDLEGLFVRLNHWIDSVGAKRVVLESGSIPRSRGRSRDGSRYRSAMRCPRCSGRSRPIRSRSGW